MTQLALGLPIPYFCGVFINLLHQVSPPLSPLGEMPPAFGHFQKHGPIWSGGFLAKPKAFSGIPPVLFSFTHFTQAPIHANLSKRSIKGSGSIR
jgi:hypothetical protein